MEDDLFDWVVELRGRHLRVSRQMMRTQAKALSGNEEFKAMQSGVAGQVHETTFPLPST